jgi:hypothetical protein
MKLIINNLYYTKEINMQYQLRNPEQDFYLYVCDEYGMMVDKSSYGSVQAYVKTYLESFAVPVRGSVKYYDENNNLELDYIPLDPYEVEKRIKQNVYKNLWSFTKLDLLAEVEKGIVEQYIMLGWLEEVITGSVEQPPKCLI